MIGPADVDHGTIVQRMKINFKEGSRVPAPEIE